MFHSTKIKFAAVSVAIKAAPNWILTADSFGVSLISTSGSGSTMTGGFTT